MPQSWLYTGAWLLGFREVEGRPVSHIYTEGDSTLGAETRKVRHRLASMSPFRNPEVSRKRLSGLISR
jgi:hypothetical protein